MPEAESFTIPDFVPKEKWESSVQVMLNINGLIVEAFTEEEAVAKVHEALFPLEEMDEVELIEVDLMSLRRMNGSS